MLLPELQSLAASLGISGTARMRKGELITAIAERQAAAPGGRRPAAESTGRTTRSRSNGSSTRAAAAAVAEPVTAPAKVTATAPVTGRRARARSGGRRLDGGQRSARRDQAAAERRLRPTSPSSTAPAAPRARPDRVADRAPDRTRVRRPVRPKTRTDTGERHRIAASAPTGAAGIGSATTSAARATTMARACEGNDRGPRNEGGGGDQRPEQRAAQRPWPEPR